MEAICLGEYFKLDYVELFSMKEDVWAGKGEILQPCQYLLKQAECEYFVLQPPSGTSFFSVNVNQSFLSFCVASIL